jgi:hypothetical protein
MHRRTSSYGKPAESEVNPMAYEDRLAASYRKSKEIQAKRKSISEAGGDYNEKEQHRKMIIEEIVATERDYCRDMDYLIQVIMEPLASKALLDKNDIAGIFSNIQEIRAVNTALLQQLEQSAHLSAQTVGEIFTKMSPFFKCYSKYCTNHINSLNILRERKAERQELAVYFKTLKFNTNSGKLGVEDYLIKPIQRICKYPLFFHQLLEYTPPGGRDHSALTEANTQMQKVAAHVNEFHRDAENMNRVLEIQSGVHGIPFSLVASSRKFIFEQIATIKTLEEPNWNTRNLYLFSDILLYAKPPSKFTKKTTYVGCVELDAVSFSDRDNELSLDKHDGTPLLKINCLSDSEKAQWSKHISGAISDNSTRRMSLQAALKETANGQHESRSDFVRRSSYRNSMLNLNHDEILSRRSTLRHVDAGMFGRYRTTPENNFPTSNEPVLPPQNGRPQPPVSRPKKQPAQQAPGGKPAPASSLKQHPLKPSSSNHQITPPQVVVSPPPTATLRSISPTPTMPVALPRATSPIPPTPAPILTPQTTSQPPPTSYYQPASGVPPHFASIAPPQQSSVPHVSPAAPFSYPIHTSTATPHSFPPMPTTHTTPPTTPTYASMPPMPAPSLKPPTSIPSLSTIPGFTSIPSFTPLPPLEPTPQPAPASSPFSPVLSMDPTPSLIPTTPTQEEPPQAEDTIISSAIETTLTISRPQPPPRRVRAATEPARPLYSEPANQHRVLPEPGNKHRPLPEPVNQQGQQQSRQLPAPPKDKASRMSLGPQMTNVHS